MSGAPSGRLRIWTLAALAAALALVSLWVAEVTRNRTDDALPQPAKTTPDYYVDGFRFVQMAANGQPSYTVSGKKMTHFPADDSAVIDKPVLRSLAAEKPAMSIVADRARSVEDNTKVHLYGNVQADRPATPKEQRLLITSEYMMVLPNEDIVKTDKPVTIRLGQSVVRGAGMVANNATRRVEVTGNVRSTYIAPPK